MYSLKQESQADFWEVEALFDLCFAPGREALSSYRLRDGVAPCHRLCLVARDRDGVLAGAIRYWPVRIMARAPAALREPCGSGPSAAPSGRDAFPALLLGPIAVHPTRQGEGLGGVLIRDSLALARDLPASGNRILLVGDAPYYSRFGFSPLRGVVMPPPTNPARVLGRALRPDAWKGVAGVVCPARPAALA